MKTDLERILHDIGEEVPPVRTVPTEMLQRARRRIALTVSVTLLALSAAGGGAFAAVQAASSPPRPTPAATGPTTIPTTGASPTQTLQSQNPVWIHLARPLHLPTIAPGAPCPITTQFGLPPNRVVPRQDWIHYAGAGPVYVSGYVDHGMAHWKGDIPVTRGWHPTTFLWLSARAAGPILVSGTQIDGPNGIRFGGIQGVEGASPALTQARLSPNRNNQEYLNPGLRPSGWHLYAATTFFRAPGCYALQMDGLAFSEVVVFRAGP
ncbi:MAG: hypothetical protein M3Q23_14360 [Actinomycetota bacterium]|nr:hypothetical protein [Actinomycetota bacterium]